MIGLLLMAGLTAVGVIGIAALRGGRPFAATRSGPAQPEPPHRQAIQHFASGVLPPWR